ncbi:asparagine synthase-related protein [Psychroserpens sp. XS_ASV72]|uniref:asparagine synthase-related protein n=1 Tax=Psychroserpens sp. XS_ASV72 TaxID=3241293 RepID=UPI0035176CCD
MNYNSTIKSVPAFGGIISKTKKQSDDNPLVNQIYNNESLQLFTCNAPKENNYYILNEGHFLWFGGTTKTSEIHSFDIFKNDDKFIQLKFDKDKIQLFTDHYSKIPLFYIQNDDSFVFSSSLELLRILNPTKTLEFSDDGLLFYYNFGFADYKNFLVKGVNSAPGGQELTYAIPTGKLTQITYHNIFDVKSYANNSNTLKQNVKQIDEVLLKATKKTLQGFNSIGIALSGGVDSGYLAQKIHECNRDFKAYTLGFKDDYNEFERIDYLSNKLDFKVQKIRISPEDIINNYLDVVERSSFPVGFNNSILNIIYKEANSDGIELMFDGDGADRLFLGMNKYVQLQKILQLYKRSKKTGMHKVMAALLNGIGHPTTKKLSFYFQKFNEGIPFYGERKLANNQSFVKAYEAKINDMALPEELKLMSNRIDDWLFFSLFSVYYTPSFFFHTPYELQLCHNMVSNPQFWSDDMVDLALSIPVDQKLHKKTTKKVLREAAKLKIDDGYWNLSKIGLQNSYHYMRNSQKGSTFINDHISSIKTSDMYACLKEHVPQKDIDAERLLPFYIWKKTLFDT